MTIDYFEDIEEGNELPPIDMFLSKDQVRQLPARRT